MKYARLSVKGLAMAVGIYWGGAVALVGAANTVWPEYGVAFLQLTASVYPGYSIETGSVPILTIYGLIDGALGGAIFGLLYNLCIKERKNKS